MKTVIFDIDGTLANCEHRVQYLLGETPDWEAFYGALQDDKPVECVADLAWMIHQAGWKIILCTGRPEKYRGATVWWLREQNIHFHTLYMRPDGDHRQDHAIKREMLGMIRAAGCEVAFVVEDRSSVVKMWRDEGLVCLQCAAGDF